MLSRTKLLKAFMSYFQLSQNHCPYITIKEKHLTKNKENFNAFSDKRKQRTDNEARKT
jgi:hypothetical protein